MASFGEPIVIRLEALIVRDPDLRTLEPLTPVEEHRSVHLAPDIRPEVHHEIRADTQDFHAE